MGSATTETKNARSGKTDFMNKTFSNCEVNELSRRAQGKRTLANFEACKLDLRSVMPILFKSFSQALGKCTYTLQNFRAEAHARAFEATILQTAFFECLTENFGDKAFWGKYKRIILNLPGYLILFKKLDKRCRPMNIKTVCINSILGQDQTLDLFSDSTYNDVPILYFGYQKNKFGVYSEPLLVYIDGGEVQFSISEQDYSVWESPISSQQTMPVGVMPTLKHDLPMKKAN